MILSEIQSAIVRHEGGNVLVSAAAGSGKTTVMTKRIIRILTDEEKKTPVGRLLVVTFTNAAAAHMKEAIFKELREAVGDHPESTWLSEQLLNFPMARIMTIDAFCLRVMKENIHLIDELDPGFRVGGTNEIALMKKDALAQTLEDLYAQAEEDPAGMADFLYFIDTSCGKKKDTVIEPLVENAFDYILAMPSPLIWLNDRTEAYHDPHMTPELEGMIRDLTAGKIAGLLEDFSGLLDNYPVEAPYFEKVCAIFEDLSEKIVNAPLPELVESLCFTFPRRAGRIESQYEDPYIAARVTDRIKDLKEEWKGFSSVLSNAYRHFVSASPEDAAYRQNQYRYLSGLRQVLVTLYHKFAAAKAERSVVDFSDFSHFALQILCEKDERGEYFSPSVPTLTAQMIRKGIDYIFIDEYQDSNTIQELILTSVAKRNEKGEPVNIFMVGDVKQSIYRFRHAEPDLFMEKSRTYLKTQADDTYHDLVPRKFVLSENRRSERAVLNAGNFIFGSVMSGGSSEILYNDDEKLNFPADKEEGDSEVVLAVLPKFRELPKTAGHDAADEVSEDGLPELERLNFEEEACFIARSVKKLLAENRMITVKENNALMRRPLQKKDIAVLLPKIKSIGHLMQKALDEVGIESVTESSLPFFESSEIVLVCQILAIIDNPRQDIPLAAVLHSPCFGFTPNELARIRLADKEESFYDALHYYGGHFRNELAEKTRAFEKMLSDWREMNLHESVHDLLWQIFVQTDLYLYVSAMPGGDIRMANLDKMLDLAVSFENSTYSGLYQFLRYLDLVERYESEEGEAKTEGDADVVRILTIHKSKGLEFPAVFLGGLGFGLLFKKSFSGPNIQMDKELGFGLPDAYTGCGTGLYTLLIKERSAVLEKAERARLLYVGMTRAISYLYMSGMGSWGTDAARPGDPSSVQYGTSYRMTEHQFLSGRTYLDWIQQVLDNASENGVSCPFEVRLAMPIEDFDEDEDEASAASSEQVSAAFSADEFEWKYPFGKDLSLKARYSVSEIKKDAHIDPEESETDAEKTVHLAWDGKGAERGTIMHSFFANADWAQIKSECDIETEIERLIGKEILTEKEAELLLPKALWKFRQSPLCERMIASARVWKEQPFILSLGVEEIRALSDAWPEEVGEDGSPVMIQGIIDLFFEEDGELVLVDYKTDRNLGDRELKMYGLQLEIYKRALERILGMRVKEKYLYSTSMGTQIKIS